MAHHTTPGDSLVDDFVTHPCARFTSAIDEEVLLAEIANTELPAEVTGLNNRYDDLIGVRDPFIWRWIYASVQLTQLSCVPCDVHQTVTTVKTLTAMYMVVIDDIAEQLGDRQLFDAVTSIPFRPGRSEPEWTVSDLDSSAHLTFAREVWDTVEDLLHEAPRADEFWSLLKFDMERVFLSIRYSFIGNEMPAMMNFIEGITVQSRNMFHYVNADIDMMFSPGFERRDLAALRRHIWYGEQLHRLTNWVYTWERELEEGDVSAGIFSLACTADILDVTALEMVQTGCADTDRLRNHIKQHNLDEWLLDLWHRLYREMIKLTTTTSTVSVDLAEYMTGVRHVCKCCAVASDKK